MIRSILLRALVFFVVLIPLLTVVSCLRLKVIEAHALVTAFQSYGVPTVPVRSPSSPSVHEPPSSSRVVGPPSVRADFIDRVLRAYHSSALGEGQHIYDDGVQFGIDPVFALAFFMHESSFGLAGEATASFNPGNIRCLPGVF